MPLTKFPSGYYPKDFSDFIERKLSIAHEPKCPDCRGTSIETELHDFIGLDGTFNDIAYCKDCHEVFELITKRK